MIIMRKKTSKTKPVVGGVMISDVGCESDAAEVKRAFSQPQLLCSIDSIYNYYNFFLFFDNTTNFYWMKKTNSYFLRIVSKVPVRIQTNSYTSFEWIWQRNLQNFIFSWRVLCEKIKIKISSSLNIVQDETQKIWRVCLCLPKKIT